MNSESIYKQRGYESRKHYLICLAEDYGIDVQTVFMLASMLGESEDFDGLVTQLDDLADGYL